MKPDRAVLLKKIAAKIKAGTKRRGRAREASIEQRCVDWARERGVLARKMNGFGFNSWPDRLFLGRSRAGVWIEFKRPGERPTLAQARVHQDLLARNQAVYVIDNLEDFKAVLRIELGVKE